MLPSSSRRLVSLSLSRARAHHLPLVATVPESKDVYGAAVSFIAYRLLVPDSIVFDRVNKIDTNSAAQHSKTAVQCQNIVKSSDVSRLWKPFRTTPSRLRRCTHARTR